MKVIIRVLQAGLLALLFASNGYATVINDHGSSSCADVHSVFGCTTHSGWSTSHTEPDDDDDDNDWDEDYHEFPPGSLPDIDWPTHADKGHGWDDDDIDFDFDDKDHHHLIHETPPAVPVPPALWLFVSGLAGLVGLLRRKRR